MLENENNRIQMDFLEVCSFGDLERVKAMLRNEKIDISFQHHSNGWTALHWAARRNHDEVVKLLLQAGFDPKSPAKDGKTPLDLATNKTVKEIFKQLINNKDNQEAACETSFSHEMNSDEKLDSLHHTRFLLVRTSFKDGKECFKRIAVPERATVDILKSVIEKTMKKGKVLDVITLQDNMKIKTEEQIRNLGNDQEVEVIFNSAVMGEETNCTLKLMDDDQTTCLDRAFQFSPVNSECLKPKRSVEDIKSFNDTSISTHVDDSFVRIKDSDSISEEQVVDEKTSVVMETSEFLLTAHSCSSTADITIPSKISTDMIKLEVVSSQQNYDQVGQDKSIQSAKSETIRDHKSLESESEIETRPAIMSLSPKVKLNEIIIKNVSRKRLIQIALIMGCFFGVGGLMYMKMKKLSNYNA